MTEKQYKNALQQLSIFLKKEDGLIMLAHMSMRNWLLSQSNQRYFVPVLF